MERASIELVMRARRREASAFSRLVEQYERAALAVAYAVVGESDGAGDVVQEAFMKAWRCVAELREAEQFGPWLMRIVRNAGHDYRRRKGVTGQEVGEGVAAMMDGPREMAERGEVCERIDAALGELDEVTRMVVAMKYYKGLASREIGELLGLSAAAVDMRLSRGRGELRRKLSVVAGTKE
jgi:RNA polymerase sigma-70 factor (ECF subfamily)